MNEIKKICEAEHKKTESIRKDIRETIKEVNKNAKELMTRALDVGSYAIKKMMDIAGVCAVYLTKDYDSTFMGVEDGTLVRMDAVFLHNGNLYGYASETASEAPENALDEVFAGKQHILSTDPKRADDFVEETDNPLYNILDDTTAPSETVSELLTSVYEVLANNDLI